MNLERIKQLAEEILAELNVGGATVPVTPPASSPIDADQAWRNETGFPKIKTVGNCNYMLQKPLNPVYTGSVTNFMIGGVDKGGAYLADPGGPNGDRSPAGLPMINGQVMYGGSVFPNDQAVRDYLVSVGNRDAELIKAGGSFSPYNPDGTPRG